ncbi:unnamed protein product [Dovyalis caffra]|uniref:Uncharacterized protein n=1 Tax=Dovyalis caffra TaxID=77055 RepID=A0AAV1RN62_9ROSI|nr:unnamed protein product [Dovyalis caffra]
MASFNYLLLFMVLTFTGQFSHCFGKSSRKELRNKEDPLETVIQSGSSIQTNRVDPSRVVTLSWRPRSGPVFWLFRTKYFQGLKKEFQLGLSFPKACLVTRAPVFLERLFCSVNYASDLVFHVVA